MWLKAGMFGDGTYVVYPLAPDVADMVDSENTAQVVMSSRFVFSRRDDFASARILPQQSALMSTLLIGRRVSGLHR